MPETFLTLDRLRARLPFWNINGLVAYVLKTVTRFKVEYRESFARVAEDRVYMTKRLFEVPGLMVYPSKANFLFVELPDGGSRQQSRCVERFKGEVNDGSDNRGGSAGLQFSQSFGR